MEELKICKTNIKKKMWVTDIHKHFFIITTSGHIPVVHRNTFVHYYHASLGDTMAHSKLKSNNDIGLKNPQNREKKNII